MSGPAILEKDERTYKVFGLAERAAAISKASTEMDTIISDRVAAAKAALERWEGPHAGTFVEQVNAVLTKMATLKLALWSASARLSSFPVPSNGSVGTVHFYDSVYARAQVAAVRPVGPDSIGAEPDKLRQYVKVASGQDERFATLARTVTFDGVSATVTFRREPNAAEQTENIRPGELISLPDAASLVPPLVADSAAVSEFTTGVATAFENTDRPLLDLLAKYPELVSYTVDGFAPGRVSGESSLAIALAHFEKFDTAAHGGDPDGNISQSDLEAIRNNRSLPSYVRDAATHLLDSPTLVRLVTGGRSFLTRDGITTFVEMNQTARTVDQHFTQFDTAAKGGKPDGFVSADDLRATANDQSLGADVRHAAQWLLDHPEQLGSNPVYSYPVPSYPGYPSYSGFTRRDLTRRIVDGQVYGDDPEAAERFVNSLPVADRGESGLPIWLCSTDGVKSLANAALLGTDGDLTDQQSVIAHLPETKDAIRNELITAYYEMLSKRADKIFAGGVTGDPAVPGHPGANWLIYGTWASNGVHDVINGQFSALGIHPSMDDRQNAADGNQWIFNDLTARFAAFTELYEKNSYSPNSEQIEIFFRSNFHEGDAELRNGFAAYVAATREADPAKRQALMFQGNILMTAHEQAGVQPYLEGVGKPLVPDDIEVEFIDVRLGRHRIEVNKDIPNIAGANNLIVNRNIFDLDAGGKRPADFSLSDLLFAPTGAPSRPGVVRLDDISGIQGFPTSFTTWHQKGGETYDYISTGHGLAKIPKQSNPDDLKGSAATEWTDYDERMWSIVKLFEQTHTDSSLYDTGGMQRSFDDYGWLDPAARPRPPR